MKQTVKWIALGITTACIHPRLPMVPPPPAPSTSPATAQTEPSDSTAPAIAVGGDSSPAAQAGAPGPDTLFLDSLKLSALDVSRRAAEVFGDQPVPVGATVHDSAVGPSWDIEVRSYETTDRVAYYVKRFSGRSKEHIVAELDRGSRYEPMIRAAMRAGKLPEDMYYLGLIESGFDPNAYSSAAAVGMWQFMTSTARDMGMRVDWWIDERRDPVRSTIAAVRFIRGLKEQFGSLYLAAAAYDGGPGRVARGLARYADGLEGTKGEDRFFALAETDYLPRETREYVPQIIAAALIAKEPLRYGIVLHPQPPFVYDSVRVAPATPLAAIAKAANVTLAAIQDLNPHVLRGMSPPRDAIFVRVPPGSRAGLDSALAALPAGDRLAFHRVVSKKGDRLEDIAHRARLATASVAAFNPRLERSRKTGRLVPGQIVIVPTAAVAAAALPVPDPAIERFASSKRMKLHVVRHGETLSGIARRNHTTAKALMRLNGLRRPMIFPGQTLAVTGRPRRIHRRRARSVRATRGKL